MDLTDKVALVTGGARGLGKGYAEAMLKRGANVVIADINVKVGRETEEELKESYGEKKIEFMPCDVAGKEQLEWLFRNTKEIYGRLDIVVNNVGIVNELHYELMIQVNLISVIRGTRLAVEHMSTSKGGNGGVVVNISSIAGVMSLPYLPTYCATKHGVLGWTKCFAVEAAEVGVRVVALCPSFVDTDFTFDAITSHPENAPLPIRAMRREMGILKIPEVVDAFLRLIDDTHNNGGAMQVSKEGIEYLFPSEIKGKLK